MKVDSITIPNKYDNYLADAAAFIFGKLFIESIIGAICNRIGLRGMGVEIVITNILYAIFLTRTIVVIKKRLTIDMFVVIFFFLITICFTSLAYYKNDEYILNGLANLFFFCIPGYIIFRSIADINSFVERFRYGMYAVFVFGTIYLFGYSLRNSIRGMKDYDMVFSYSYVVPILFFIYWGIKKKSLVHYLIAAIGALFILVQGSRGALLCIVVCVLLYILRGNIRLRWKLLIGSVSSILIFIIITNSVRFFSKIKTVLGDYGIQSRTVNYILNNSIYSTSGRNVIIERSIEAIEKNGIVGLGLYGDRVILDGYPHNIFLELLLQYGTIMGWAFIVLLIFLILYALLSKKNETGWRDFAIVLISYSLVYKCLSGSYLNDPDFLIMIGFLINAMNKYGSKYKIKKKGSICYHQ